MSNPTVTIQNCKEAVYLVINGAIRNIEANHDGEDESKVIVKLFDEIAESMSEWDIDSAANRQAKMVQEMQVMLTSFNCPDVIGELLVKFKLLP